MPPRKSQAAAERPKFQAGAELRARVVEAAAHLFSQDGYERVSLRRIADEVGCSAMAMYRHFPDKDTLIRHVCTELYERFTVRMHAKLESIEDPGLRLEELAQQFVEFALHHPNHYRLTFLTPAPAGAEPAPPVRPPVEFLRETFRELLPAKTPLATIDERVNQVIVSMHGTAVVLLAPRRTPTSTRAEAYRQLRAMVRLIYTAPPPRTL